MRKYLRAIAKARMKACGVGNVNKKMARKNEKGEKLWRAFLWGEYAEQGRKAQVKPKRKVRRISPVAG